MYKYIDPGFAGHLRIYKKILSDLIRERPYSSLADLIENAKSFCARSRIPYDRCQLNLALQSMGTRLDAAITNLSPAGGAVRATAPPAQPSACDARARLQDLQCELEARGLSARGLDRILVPARDHTNRTLEQIAAWRQGNGRAPTHRRTPQGWEPIGKEE